MNWKPGDVAHDKITTQNGRVIRIEWERYLGGGGYAQWSADILPDEDGHRVMIARRYDDRPAEALVFPLSEAMELHEKLTILVDKGVA